MTTLLQLPQALTTSTTDLVLVEQSEVTAAVTLGTLLQGTQAKLTLASGALLGRASALPGSPEPIGVGSGLAFEGGLLTIDELTIANLDSPAFYGCPTAPTPQIGDSSNAIATTGYVQANLPTTSIIGDAFGSGTGTLTLTLPQLTTAGTFTKLTVNGKGQVIGGTSLDAADVSGALGFMPYSDANPAGYITPSAVSGLAPLASPALSGTPTAPTPPFGDNSSAVATTAFVHASAGPITITGDVSGAGAGSVNVTLPNITSAGTYAKVTVNAKGQVTAGGTLDSADLMPALGFTPYNASNPAGYIAASVVSSFPVLSYGAYFDGVHDDYPGITAAIAAAASAGGGDVIFPPWHGKISRTVFQPNNNVRLRGFGSGLAVYNSAPTTVTPQTRITWIGAAGGTMFVVGAPNNSTPSGTRVVNCPADGILLDGATLAAIGWDIRSVALSDFGVLLAMECTYKNVQITTSWLAPSTATAAGEVNDTQGNSFPRIYSSHRTLIATTVGAGGTAGTASSTVPVTSTAGFVVGMKVQVGVANVQYIVASIGTGTITFTTTVTAADNVTGNPVMYAPYALFVGALLPSQVPGGYQAGGAYAGTPVLGLGDVSGNRFGHIIFDHDVYAGDAVSFGWMGNNNVDMLYGSLWGLTPSGGNNTWGYGLSMEGGNGGGYYGCNGLTINEIGIPWIARGAQSGYGYPPIAPKLNRYDYTAGGGSRTYQIDTNPLTGLPIAVDWGSDQNPPNLQWNYPGVINVATLNPAVMMPTTIELGAGGYYLDFDSNAGFPRFFTFSSAGKMRWQIGANYGAESGANAGADLVFGAYADDGATFLNNWLAITRATGAVSMPGAMTAGSLIVGGAASLHAVTATGTLSVTGATSLAAVSATNVTATGTLSVTGTAALAGVSATNINATGTAYICNLVAYEASWEPSAGTFNHASSSSLVIVNGSNDHLHIVSALAPTGFSGASDWLVRNNDGNGNFEILPVANTGSIKLEGTLGVEIVGPLVLDSSFSAAGVSTLAGLSVTNIVASSSLWVAGATTLTALSATSITAGTIAATGVLSAPTPSSSDNSTNAATTAWVHSGYAPVSTAALSGNAAVQTVATVAALRSVAYAGLANGCAVMVLAYATSGDGGAGLFVWSSTSTAADNTGTSINPTGNSGSGRWLRQLADGRVTPQMFGAKGDGSTNDTTAFTNALASGNPVSVPAATYRVANVTVPNGAYLEGTAGLGYSYDVYGSPNASQKAAVVSPILVAVSGTTSCILNVSGSSDLTIKGLFLDGGANTATCDGISSGSTQMLLERVTVTRCINGLGSVANTDLYTHVAAIIYCEFCNNTNGISNLIDSNLFHTAVSANSVGINLGSGAGANTFLGGRYEWNSSCGMQGYQCASNMVIGGLFDRNSGAAVNLGTGCADFTFNGVQFNRNGANNTYPGNAHIQLNGTTSVVFIGCVSQSGNNNAPTGQPQGNTTPAYFIEFLNTNGYCVIEGSDCSGYVTGFSFGTNPTQFVQRDNTGAGANFANAQQPFMSNGRVALTLYEKASANITPGQSATFPMTQAPFTSNYATMARALNITAQNFNAPYQQQAASFRLMFNRGTSTGYTSASAAFGECGGTGVITWGTSSKLGLAISAVASDASTFTLTVTNNGTADGSNWGVWAELE
jgi:hypothetical protein